MDDSLGDLHLQLAIVPEQQVVLAQAHVQALPHAVRRSHYPAEWDQGATAECFLYPKQYDISLILFSIRSDKNYMDHENITHFIRLAEAKVFHNTDCE